MRTLRLPSLVALAFLSAAATTLGSTIVYCAFGGTPNDHADSGIVIASYPGTNVRRLHDTKTSATLTYSNTDGVVAVPVQDTSALPRP
jgi:hypothetical protein